MKSVKFAKSFRHKLSDTSYQEWPAGCSDIVSDEIAKKALDEGALDGDPVDAPKSDTKEQSVAAKKV